MAASSALAAPALANANNKTPDMARITGCLHVRMGGSWNRNGAKGNR